MFRSVLSHRGLGLEAKDGVLKICEIPDFHFEELSSKRMLSLTSLTKISSTTDCGVLILGVKEAKWPLQMAHKGSWIMGTFGKFHADAQRNERFSENVTEAWMTSQCSDLCIPHVSSDNQSHAWQTKFDQLVSLGALLHPNPRITVSTPAICHVTETVSYWNGCGQELACVFCCIDGIPFQRNTNLQMYRRTAISVEYGSSLSMVQHH